MWSTEATDCLNKDKDQQVLVESYMGYYLESYTLLLSI